MAPCLLDPTTQKPITRSPEARIPEARSPEPRHDLPECEYSITPVSFIAGSSPTSRPTYVSRPRKITAKPLVNGNKKGGGVTFNGKIFCRGEKHRNGFLENAQYGRLLGGKDPS
ncbi:hypothetical protein MAPG_03103 [Magnaporthiopsis poae ATCC 64411]|uniref:Uncharacterized protein n=1 Tax=Magnaporthiopsis poae (strain ATCC 64411 / 73-15) TaxID=644358 RepID=A0A0C4CSD3_MAGP6|nr:hypothetical protein, variant [Magnaporthiopsis poae ATCC 64411]KLU84058.1 hypothetical protein MAPG_03103 [Magnaporthiopsis poae ATCC 64411]